MPVAQSVMSSVLMAPGITLFSSLSLVVLRRGIETLQTFATTPQKGLRRQIKPYVKYVNEIVERVLSGVKFDVTTTDILLMTVIVLLIAVLIEMNERREVKESNRPPPPAKTKESKSN
jgi:hypothetical protein